MGIQIFNKINIHPQKKNIIPTQYFNKNKPKNIKIQDLQLKPSSKKLSNFNWTIKQKDPIKTHIQKQIKFHFERVWVKVYQPCDLTQRREKAKRRERKWWWRRRRRSKWRWIVRWRAWLMKEDHPPKSTVEIFGNVKKMGEKLCKIQVDLTHWRWVFSGFFRNSSFVDVSGTSSNEEGKREKPCVGVRLTLFHILIFHHYLSVMTWCMNMVSLSFFFLTWQMGLIWVSCG